MEKLLELLKPRTFGKYGYIVAILCAIAGIILSGFIINLGTTEERQFSCESHSSIKNQVFLQTRCYDQYNQQTYNSPIPLMLFVLGTFSSLVVVCIIYSLYIKSKVDQVEQVCTPDPENPQPTQMMGTRQVFLFYFSHLVIRFILGSCFVVYQALHILSFPSQFDCRWDFSKSTTSAKLNATHSNSSLLIDCQNSAARKKTAVAIGVFTVHIILAVLVMIETVYLLHKRSRDKNFMDDSKFCGTYFLKINEVPTIRQQRYIRGSRKRYEVSTENLDPLIPPSPGNNDNRRTMDDIYIDLIIYSGRIAHEFGHVKNRHELLHAHLEVPESSVRIDNLEDLFVSNEKSYNKILVVGRPGIGKSLLCTKIIREWSQGTLLQNTTKSFKYVFLYRFRHLNTKGMEKMSLKQFLSRAEHSAGTILGNSVLQSLIDNPEEVLIIFDGLDEYKHRNDFMVDELKFTCLNGVTDQLPVSALYVKLLQNKLLSGATVVTTTRPHALESIKSIQFDRDLEILGFTPEKVKSYVDKVCKDDVNIGNKIWDHIHRNINLLYLCYIPATCTIVCDLFKHYIKELQAGCHSISLPTTLTDVYEGALRMFLFKHHPEYQCQANKEFYACKDFLPSVEKDLAKLGCLAKEGLSEKRLIFEEGEVQGIENCGLLHCMPNKKTPLFGYARSSQYCFLHLTLQEFIAARDIVTNMDPEEIADFIKSKAKDTNWHLVIQFIAGLTRGQKFHKVTDCFVETFHDSLSSSKQDDRRLALLMMKCLYELNDENVVKRAASELASRKDFHQDVKLNSLGITAFDCTAIAYVLRHLKSSLDQLNLNSNYTLGDSGCSELALLLKEASPKDLHMERCNITGEGIKALFGRVNWEKPCQLTELHLTENQISDDGVSHLCEALNHKNCNVVKLLLSQNKITDEGLLYLRRSLQHDNCKLTYLILGDNHQISDDGVSHLCEALKHENCNLINLQLPRNKITDKGVLYLRDSLQHDNCKLTDLYLHGNRQITDKGLSYLSEALGHKNCHLTRVTLAGRSITDIGVSHLCNALENENNQLASLCLGDLIGTSSVTDQGVSCLCKALAHVNCKLYSLDLDSNQITDQGVSYLCEALAHVNCKLYSLELHSDQITDQGVSCLCEALKHKNCKVTEMKLETAQIKDRDEVRLQMNEAITSRKHSVRHT